MKEDDHDGESVVAAAGREAIHASRFIVESTVKNGPSEIAEGIIEIHKFQTTPAMVSVTLGGTVNLGNYESAKFSVTISRPCYSEEIDCAYEEIRSDAEKKAIDVINRFKKAKKDG